MSIALPMLPLRSPTASAWPRAAKASQGGDPPPAPIEAHREGVLRDSHGRVIHDLRLSITDRCNFRCVYCMDPEVRFFGQDEVLTRAEMVRLVRVCAGLGIRKLRLTGGEPTLHPDLGGIIADVASLRAGADALDVALTTNGSLLDAVSLHRWKESGLSRITISIDAVSPGAFAALTRSASRVDAVIRGIRAAIDAGLCPVKLNAVIIRGRNEDQIVPLAGLAREHAVDMRFIEFMPLDSSHAWDRGLVVSAEEVIRAVSAAYPLVPLGRDDESSTSESFLFADGRGGRVGTIAPVSRPFCGACSRLRITADGKVRPCLFSTTEWDLRPLLRGGASDGQIRAFIIDSVWTKQAGHGISSDTFTQPDRPMSAIGG